ncbi:MAG: hypothetical protein OEL57_02240 [Trichlorobacter sp.]|uniref:hypothetical protein n=1 Tax=Trichlorobacter sp. TaxID=2911007 RepID=UPI00255E68FE|nr:hypothetical protein [Trichlorobacter sp.]MDK9716710.1 hypothetical protein [Trichlorobacter sp.]
MGTAVQKQTCRTVGEVVDALSVFNRDLPVECGLDDCVTVYRVEPDIRGGLERVEICGDDPWAGEE